MLKKIAALLLVPVLLAGCSAAGDVETLLRAPQLSGESAALQKALNNYLGGSATLKYPASGDFLSPFAFGDWDGDGTDEAAVLYTTDTTSSNVWLAVLEPTGESSWRVSRVVEGLTSEVQSFSAAHLRDTSSQQLLAGYVSPQGDQYLVVYQYDGDTLSTVISKSYTDMIVADFTGKGDTQDLVLALPPDTELGGVTLQLLTANDGEFRSTQTLNLGEGVYSSCAALHAGTGSDDGMYLVMDAWTGTSSLVSDIILYDEATGFLQPYRPSGMSDIQRSTLRYHRELLSRDLDDNGTVDIPVEIDDGGTHILLCHYPILHEKGGYMIHGHIHNQRNHAYEILKTLPRVLNAGVDINFYRPVPLDELVENNRKYYSEEYPELFPVPPRPDRSAPGLMPRKPDFRPLPQRH